LAPRSAPELAAGLQIDVRSARRLLKRLCAEGYIVQDGGYRRRYRATLQLVTLARQLLAHATLPRLAASRLAELADGPARVAHLWIPADGETLCVMHAHPGAADGVPHVLSADDLAAAAVLGLARRQQRSYAYVRDRDHGAAAAAILDHGTVVAALGVTGDVAEDDLAPVALAARTLTRDLAAAAA
jgi:DNA-binding IclR family transcriptional regulator